ncbi:MAG: hypothetical protein V4508_16910 [Pseudomonadota bacterium]
MILVGCDHREERSIAIVTAGLARAAPALSAEIDREKMRCTSGGWGHLTIVEGKVNRSRDFDEFGGYAREANTTGGLGGELVLVTTTADYDPKVNESVIPGTLRAAVEKAASQHTAVWIVFAPELGPAAIVTLKRALKLPDNITLDGSCADVTLQSRSNVGLIDIYGTKNVIVERLRFRKTDYRPSAEEGDTKSAIRLNGAFDRIEIIHNDLAACGDGCIDITTSPHASLPSLARVSVEFNRISDHDKTMLFGNFTCNDVGLKPCDQTYIDTHINTPPVFFLTLHGNLFLRSAQRHPRVFGYAMAHVVNNVMALAPLRRADGTYSDLSGVFVADDARALVEANLFAPQWRERMAPRGFQAVWTTTTPGAEAMPGDGEGFIRVRRNVVTARSIVAESHPERVADPSYETHMVILPFELMAPEQVVACIAARAGPAGGRDWDRSLCN